MSQKCNSVIQNSLKIFKISSHPSIVCENLPRGAPVEARSKISQFLSSEEFEHKTSTKILPIAIERLWNGDLLEAGRRALVTP